MKIAPVLLLAASLLWTGEAIADPGNGPAQHDNNGNGPGSDNGQGNGPGAGPATPGVGPGGNGPGAGPAPPGGGPADPGNGNGPGNGAGSIKAPAGPLPGGPDSTDQNNALEAVKSGQALPLSSIVPLAETKWGGRVIDAELVRVQGTLLYRLTMLDDNGVSRRVYYQARTGRPVATR